MANKKASADTVRTGIEEITTQGDLLYRGATDLKHLPKGSSGQQLSMGNSNEPEWITVADELPAAGTSGNVLTSTGSAWNSAALASSGFTLKGAPVATTSGANIDISGFPAGISMMVVGFMGISCESTVDMQFQMGTASGLPANVYSWSVSAELRGSSYPDMIDSNSSFPINANWHGHTFVYDGQMIITRMSTSNAWTASWNVSASKSSYFQLSAGAGKISDLGGEFTQIRLRNGGHNFDAGSVNFAYLL